MRSIIQGTAIATLAFTATFASVDTAAAQVHEAAELTEVPRLVSPRAAQRQIQAAYPRALQSAGVAGRVVLQLIVLADGSVDGARIDVAEADHDGLAEAARSAARQIKFIPGEVNGTAVAARVLFPITFASN